jgi:hypothetical protein
MHKRVEVVEEEMIGMMRVQLVVVGVVMKRRENALGLFHPMCKVVIS